MDTPTYPSLQVEIRGSIATVALDRPEVHNAFNETLIASLTQAFRELGAREDLRAIVLRGNGPSFCAGADIRYMGSSLHWTRAENIADATQLAEMLDAVNTCPLVVVGRVHGSALGGGMGLVACCDLAIAAEGTRFGFTEVRLGLAPATIAPYVIARIGQSQARSLFVTGERFDAAQALTVGLVQRVVPAADLEAAMDGVVAQLRGNGPQAMRAAKTLALRVPTMAPDEARAFTVGMIADLRVSAEAQEGLHAFAEKRKASWAEEA
jgi:methylglutaconyl-CoA hydratase